MISAEYPLSALGPTGPFLQRSLTRTCANCIPRGDGAGSWGRERGRRAASSRNSPRGRRSRLGVCVRVVRPERLFVPSATRGSLTSVLIGWAETECARSPADGFCGSYFGRNMNRPRWIGGCQHIAAHGRRNRVTRTPNARGPVPPQAARGPPPAIRRLHIAESRPVCAGLGPCGLY